MGFYRNVCLILVKADDYSVNGPSSWGLQLEEWAANLITDPQGQGHMHQHKPHGATFIYHASLKI